MLDKKLALIGGAGKIGSAILSGMFTRKAIQPENVVVTARHAASLERSRGLGVRLTTDNRAAVPGADVIMLCVHPEEMPVVLAELGQDIQTGQLVVSVATGTTTGAIEQLLRPTISVVRAMPNTAVHVGQSMTALCRGRHVCEEDLKLAVRIFETVGEVEILDERHLNAATGLGGCGPAFVFKMIEALSEGGVKVGLPREAARKMAAQVMKGAAEMVLRTGKHPAALKDEVTTPGGCTIDGIAKLEQHGISIALIDAVETSTLKAGRLFVPVPIEKL
jgi:pyrroline-5-carboxylate reductase